MEIVPLVLVEDLGNGSAVERGGLDGGGLVVARGPVGGARSLTAFEGGLRDRADLDDRGGVRVRVRVEVWSFRGERERRDGGSSRRDLCFSRLLLRSLSLLSLAPSRSSSLCLRPPLSLE